MVTNKFERGKVEKEDHLQTDEKMKVGVTGGKIEPVGSWPPSRQVMTMKIDSISANEEFARVTVAVFAARLDPTVEEIEDIKTAVSEAVTNAIIHGYRNGEGIITIEAAVEEQILSVTVSDDGIGIPNVEQAMEPMFSTLPDERSGMGFSFMEAFMDKIEVISAPAKGTTVLMRKKIGR